MKYIIALAGSNSKQSINKKLVTYTAELVENTEMEVTVLDLNDFEMPLFGVDLEARNGYPESAKKLFNHIKNSDGIILSLAEHNGAYSTVFKNAFDWMSRIHSKIFAGKPMLLMASSGGARGGASVLDMAKDRFPRHDAKIIATYSLPLFESNFQAGKIIEEALNTELINKVEQFKNEVNMEVKHQKTAKNGKFYIEVNGKQEAEMTYEFIESDKIDINHTEVNDALSGQGIGYKLIDTAVEFMRENNLKATASCSYAAHIFKKKQEDYKDVISA